MPDLFFIFGAKYLFIFSFIIASFFFYKASAETRKQMIIFALVSFPLAFVLSLLAREIYFNPRPFVIGDFEPLIPHAADNGFPSDHTLLVAAVAALFTFFHKRAALWLWVVAAVVALSRVYAGIHHFADVGGSILIALISALIAYAIMRCIWNPVVKNGIPPEEQL